MSTINPVSESSAPPQAPRAGPSVADVHPGRTATGLAGGLSGLLEELGDAALFALRGVSGVVRRVGWHTPMPVSNVLGVGSVPVVALCGLFAGMIFAAQAHGQFHAYELGTCLGALIVHVVVRELGPLVVAVWFVVRVGNAMTADLAAMRATKQIDALAGRGVDPVHALVTPRLLACLVMAPLLTMLANVTGVLGGGLVCIGVYGVESHFFWQHAQGSLRMWDLMAGLIKASCFGGVIALSSCYRGFHADEGARGLRRAVTRAAVTSFAAVLVLDFFLTLFLNSLYGYLYSTGGPSSVRFW